MTHNTFKFQVGGGLESADIGVLVRGVKNENFPCPARLRALKKATHHANQMGKEISTIGVPKDREWHKAPRP